MVVPELDVVKDIPGYKVILKTLIKWQIQQLVEQLAIHTNEESVILTASVADGTLSNLGSDSGKGFLEDHEDIKSQFLGFCLKRQHRIQQLEEEEKKRQQAMLESIQHMSEPPQFDYTSPVTGKYPSGQYSRRNSRPAGKRARSPGVRHEPYPKQRSRRKSKSLDPPQPLKPEPSNASNDDVSEPNNINHYPSQSALSRDEDISNTSSSTIPNESSESNACTSSQAVEHIELDPNVLVKVENESEAELDLEMTGEDLGDTDTSQQWDPNSSFGMNFEPIQGAEGVADDTQTGHDNHEGINSNLQCDVCGKVFASKRNVQRHILLHAGIKKFECTLCKKRFTQKVHLRGHMGRHLKKVNSEWPS